MSKYNTNLAAEYYVLSTLYRLGVDAYLTLGNKKSVDIIVERPGQGIFTVDVKGLAGSTGWPAENMTRMEENHYYVLVCYENKIEQPAVIPSCWIIPSSKIGQFIREWGKRKTVTHALIRENGNKYRENWDIFK